MKISDINKAIDFYNQCLVAYLPFENDSDIYKAISGLSKAVEILVKQTTPVFFVGNMQEIDENGYWKFSEFQTGQSFNDIAKDIKLGNRYNFNRDQEQLDKAFIYDLIYLSAYPFFELFEIDNYIPDGYTIEDI